MPEHGSGISAWRNDVLDRLRTAPQGTHWVLQGPIGTGKTRAVALAARAWRAAAPTRTLIIASRVLAANLADQIDEQATMRWFSKTLLRDNAHIAFGEPEDLLAATAPGVLTDRWAVDILSSVPWDNVIIDLDAVRDDVIESLVLLAGRNSSARVVGFSATPNSEEAATRLGLTPLRFGNTSAAEDYTPEPWMAERFRTVLFERSEQEQALLASVDRAVADAGPLAQRLGLLEVQEAASSSFYAMQATALTVLERLRATRNVLVHQGLAADEPSNHEDAIEAATLIRAFASLERMAAQVDQLEFDSRQQALLQLVMESTIVDRAGSTVVFCARPATADYIDHGLRLLGLDSTTMMAVRHTETPLDTWLNNAGAFLIVTDAQLKGLDLTGARQVINYDLPGTAERLAVRLTRLRWTPRPWHLWTLLPARGQLTDREREALGWGPYLAAQQQPAGPNGT